MLTRKIIVIWYVTIIMCGCLQAQIFAPSASDSLNAIYNKVNSPDKIFIFNRSVYQAEITASIVAASVDLTPGWTFQWSVFNPSDTSYKALPVTDIGIYSNIDSISVSSGYQVVMIKGADRDTFRVWIVINDFDVKITNKDAENKLEFGYYYCESLDLKADTTRIPLFYYNPESGGKEIVVNSYLIRWYTDNEEASSPSPKLITRVYNPPYADTWYILRLTDNFGLRRSDSVFYESIQSKADIVDPAEYINLSDTAEYPDGDYGRFYNDDIKSAPGKYRFDLSGSRNLASYEIVFGDGDTLISTGDTLIVVHEFQKPGKYHVVLTTRSDEPCFDSATVDVELLYATGGGDNGNFLIPNVFTPNADNQNDILVIDDEHLGGNDIFRTEDVSVLTIDITIFDRAGHKVHSYAGSIRDWEGWDGLIKDSNREAPEGVYFYVITMLTAFEDKNNPLGNKILKGYFHLYRE